MQLHQLLSGECAGCPGLPENKSDSRQWLALNEVQSSENQTFFVDLDKYFRGWNGNLQRCLVPIATYFASAKSVSCLTQTWIKMTKSEIGKYRSAMPVMKQTLASREFSNIRREMIQKTFALILQQQNKM